MKKFLALLLVVAMVLSMVFMLASCNETTDAGSTDGNDKTDVPVDENIPNVPGADGVPSIDVVGDPNDPDAGKDQEDNYVK